MPLSLVDISVNLQLHSLPFLQEVEKRVVNYMKAVAGFEEMSKGGEVVNGMKAVNIISVNLQWLIFKNLEILGGISTSTCQ